MISAEPLAIASQAAQAAESLSLPRAPRILLRAVASRVLHVYLSAGAVGGVEKYIADLAETLEHRGFCQGVVVCAEGSAFAALLKARGIALRTVRPVRWLSHPAMRIFDLPLLWQLFRIVRQERPDIVHLHLALMETWLFKLLGLPVVLTFHGYGSLFRITGTRGRLKRFFKRLIQPLFVDTAASVDALLFVSAAEQQRMAAEQYLSRFNMGEVLYSGLHTRTLREQAMDANPVALCQALGISARSRFVLFPNRLDANKNPFAFIDFAERLYEQPDTDNVHFLIAGDGPLAAEVRARIRKSPIRHKIHWLGYRQDIPQLLGCASLALFTPGLEGFGLGVLEAMAAGTPVVAFASGGIREILTGGLAETCLVPTGDIDGLVHRGLELLRLPGHKRLQLVQRLRERAEAFNYDTFAERMEAVYARFLPA